MPQRGFACSSTESLKPQLYWIPWTEIVLVWRVFSCIVASTHQDTSSILHLRPPKCLQPCLKCPRNTILHPSISYLLKLCSASSSQTHGNICVLKKGASLVCVCMCLLGSVGVISGLVQCLSSISTHTLRCSWPSLMQLVQPGTTAFSHKKNGAGKWRRNILMKLTYILLIKVVSCSTLIWWELDL